MSTNNPTMHEKVETQLKNYDEDVRKILTKGLEYTRRNNATYVVNHLRRDIEQIVKEKSR